MTTPRVDLRRESGWDERRCRDANPEDFYQRDGEHWMDVRKRLTATAEFFCRTCPILQACRRTGEVWGMWGGLIHKRNNTVSTGVVDLLAPDERQRAG